MTVTTTSFRAMFPEFSDTTTYSDPMVTAWLGVAVNFVNADKWGDQTDFGVMLYTAHRIALAAKAVAQAAGGQIPGQFSGILTSKGADGISASYDASKIALEGRGHWNLTTYGLQFSELSNLMGAGPVVVGADDGSCDTSISAWPGVQYPFF